MGKCAQQKEQTGTVEMKKKTKEMEKGSPQNGLLFILNDEFSIIKLFRYLLGNQGWATIQKWLSVLVNTDFSTRLNWRKHKPNGYQTQASNLERKYTISSHLDCSFD